MEHKQTSPILFYDGNCGMCHRAVSYAVKRDREQRFQFAPLEGETLRAKLDESTIRELPDSIILWEAGKPLKSRSDAVIALLDALPGWGPKCWRSLLRILPKGLRDWGYGRVAAVRKRFFRAPESACPILPKELMSRFLP